MNDLRLWFVFMGVGMVTIVALNPTDPMLAAGPTTVLPVTTAGLVAMLVATTIDGRWLRRMRDRLTRGAAPDRRPGPPASHVGLCFAFAMAMQAVVIFSGNSGTTLPSWSAPWAFLALTLATELAVLMVYEKVVASLKGGTSSKA